MTPHEVYTLAALRATGTRTVLRFASLHTPFLPGCTRSSVVQVLFSNQIVAVFHVMRIPEIPLKQNDGPMPMLCRLYADIRAGSSHTIQTYLSIICMSIETNYVNKLYAQRNKFVKSGQQQYSMVYWEEDFV